MITKQLLIEKEAAIREKFGPEELAIANVSMSFFSVARYYGGAKINGHSFTYCPDDDLLVRDDVVKFLTKKKRKKAELPATEGEGQ